MQSQDEKDLIIDIADWIITILSSISIVFLLHVLWRSLTRQPLVLVLSLPEHDESHDV